MFKWLAAQLLHTLKWMSVFAFSLFSIMRLLHTLAQPDSHPNGSQPDGSAPGVQPATHQAPGGSGTQTM